jgi:VanZ family protein
MFRSNPNGLQLLRVVALVLLLVMVPSLFVMGAKPVAVGLFPVPWDKVVHFTLFAVFALLAGTAGGLVPLSGSRLMLLSFGVAVLIGALDELHQITLPGRSAGWDDFACDAAGAFIGVMVLTRLGLARPSSD